MSNVITNAGPLAALKAARQFIVNGTELGFIRMPEAETPDPANDTLPMIERAIAELEAKPAWAAVVAHRLVYVGGAATEWLDEAPEQSVLDKEREGLFHIELAYGRPFTDESAVNEVADAVLEAVFPMPEGLSTSFREFMERGAGGRLELMPAPEALTAVKCERAQVAEIVEFGLGLKEVSWVGGKMPEVGTKLYICPELPSILDLSYEEAQKVECELPPRRLPNGHTLGGLHFPAPAVERQEPVAYLIECEWRVSTSYAKGRDPIETFERSREVSFNSKKRPRSEKVRDVVITPLYAEQPAPASVVHGTVAGGDVTHNTVTVCVSGDVPSALWTIGEPVTLTHGAEGKQ